GHAWQHWYYAEFEPLRPLPIGQVVTELLGSDSELGRDALLNLARQSDLELLLATLTDLEAAAVVTKCLLPAAPKFRIAGRIAVWAQAVRAMLAGGGFVFSNSIL